MLYKLVFAATALFLLTNCTTGRSQKLSSQREKLDSLVKIGDNIYDAKEILISEGYQITYGPGFPTESNRYLLMIVDYDINPTVVESFKYAAGVSGKGTLIDGVIKANPSGEITSIK